MNNNIEVTKAVWRRIRKPSAATMRRIEWEITITQRYMTLLAVILT